MTGPGSPAQAATDLEELTVTASRGEIRLRSAGAAVTVIDREMLLASNGATLLDVLRTVPGLAVSQQGAAGTVSQIRMRGAEANHLLVLIDGVEAADAGAGGEFDFAQLPAGSLHRVEIVRGPQSSIWGSDGMAGVIQIVTQPDTNATAWEASLESGSFGTHRGSVAFSGSGEDSRAHLAIEHTQSRGTNIAREGREKDGHENTSAFLTGNLARDAWSLGYSLRATDAQSDFDANDFITTGLPVDAPHFTDYERQAGGVRLDYDGSQALSHRISANVSRNRNETDTGAAVNDIVRSERRQVAVQTNWVSTRHRVYLVTEVETEASRQRGTATVFGNPNKRHDIQTTSVAAEYRFAGDRLDTGLSARRDFNSDFDDSTAYRASGSYWIETTGTSLYLAYGLGVKNPTFTERFGYFDTFTGNPNLEPERGTSVEFGVGQQFGDATISANLYRSVLRNEINGFVFDPSSGGFTAANSAGDSMRKGAEVAFTWPLTESVSLAGAYAYLNAREDTPTGSRIEIRRPRRTGSLVIRYTGAKLRLQASAAYTGSQYDDYFPPRPPWTETVTLRSRVELGISGAFSVTRSLTVTARLTNLLDRPFEEVYGYRAPGAAAFIGLRLGW